MACEWIGWCVLEPAEQAAWVQAVGSVLAILIAVCIPAVSAWRLRRRERIDSNRRAKRGTALLYSELVELQRLLLNFDEQNDPTRAEEPDGLPPLDFWKLDSDFLSVTPRLTALIASVDTFGDADDDLFKLVVELSDYQVWMRHMADTMTAGFNNHMLRTSLPDQRDRAAQVKVLADNVMAKLVI